MGPISWMQTVISALTEVNCPPLPARQRMSAPLGVRQLEDRRVLNADFAVDVTGTTLTMDGFTVGEQLTVTETMHDFGNTGGAERAYQFDLIAGGSWTTTGLFNFDMDSLNDAMTKVGDDGTLFVRADYLDALTAGLDIRGGANLSQATFDSGMSGLTFGGDVKVNAVEVDFIGSASVDNGGGGSLTLSTDAGIIIVGENIVGPGVGMRLSQSDLATLGSGWSVVSVGDSSVPTGTVTIDSTGVTLNSSFRFSGGVGGVIAVNGDIEGAGDLTFDGAVLINGDRLIESTSAGDISFLSVIDGANPGGTDNLTITTLGGHVELAGIEAGAGSGSVPGGIDLESVVINSETLTLNAGDYTAGDFTFQTAITLTQNTTITTTGTGDVVFAGNIEGGHDLVVNSAGVTRFSGDVGSVNPLLSLTTDSDGSVEFQGVSIRTLGDQTYNEMTASLDVGDSTLTSLYGNVTVPATIVDNGYTLNSESLAVETEVTIDGDGNLIITDANGGTSDDTLTISYDAMTDEYVITDANNLLIYTDGSGTQSGHEIRVKGSDVTGTMILVHTLGGDDSLTVDFTNGDFLATHMLTLHYDGGTESTSPLGDSLTVIGGTFGTIQYSVIGNGMGRLAFDGIASIEFEGLEPVTITSLAGTVIIDVDAAGLIGGTRTIDVSDAGGGNLLIDLDGALEDLTIAAPTVELRILGDIDSDDIITISSLNGAFAAAVTIDGRGHHDVGDTITLNAALTLGDATGGNTGSLTATAETINVNASITTQNVGMNGDNVGDVTFLGGDVFLNAGASIDTSAANSGLVNIQMASSITMDDAATIDAGTHAVTLEALNDIAISRISGGVVCITTTGGAILDNRTSDESANITANAIRLSAFTGIGEGGKGDDEDIDTASLTMAPLQFAAVTESGPINIDHAGAITITTVKGTVGVEIVDFGDANGGDAISIVATGALAATAAVTNHSGGEICLESETATVTIGAAVLVDGGTGQVEIEAATDVLLSSAITTEGGHVTITAGEQVSGSTTITTTAMDDTGVASGDITIRSGLTAAGSITLTGLLDAHGAANSTGAGSAGGNVTLDANTNGGDISVGTILTFGGESTDLNGGAGGAAGDVNVIAEGTVGLAQVVAFGGNSSNGAGGAGGNVEVISVTETVTMMSIDSHGGTGQTAGGTGGDVSVQGEGQVQINGTVITGGGVGNAGIGGSAGSIALTSVAAGITVSGITANGEFGGNGIGGTGGAITLEADGDIVVSGIIQARGGAGTEGGAAGSISVTSATGTLDASNVDALGGVGITMAGGAGGTITISAAGGVTVTTLTSNGGFGATIGGNAGMIDVTSSAGNLQVSQINANGGQGTSTSGGNGGDVKLTATDGTITVSNLVNAFGGNSSGTGGNGGSVTLLADGLVSVALTNGIRTSGGIGGSGVSNAGGTGGNVSITSTSDGISIGFINTRGGSGYLGGTGGDVSLEAMGDIFVNSSTTINSSGGAGTGATGAGGAAGDITITSLGGMIFTGNLLATGGGGMTSGGNGGNGGTITLDAYTDVTIGSIDSSGNRSSGANGGDGGGVTITAQTGSILAGTIYSVGEFGLFSGTSTSTGGNGGDVTLTATASGQMIQVETINASGGLGGTGGQGGNIVVHADGAVSVTSTVPTGGIQTIGGRGSNGAGGSGGFVEVTSDSDSVTITGVVESYGRDGTTIGGSGGNIALTGATGVTVTGGISSSGATGTTWGNAGTIDVISSTGNIELASLLASGLNGGATTLMAGGYISVAGAINLASSGGGTRGNLVAEFDTDGDETVTSTFGGVVTAGTVTMSGGTDCDDILIIDGTIDAIGAVQIENVETLTINADITSGGGMVTLVACGDINVNANISSSGGNISLTADSDGMLGGGITMMDGSIINSGSGTILLMATDDITLGSIQTTNATSDAVKIISTEGSILDGGDTDLDIVANEIGAVTYLAAGVHIGVGANGGLETSIDTLNAVAGSQSGGGDIDIENTNANEVTITGLSTLGGTIHFAQTGGGDLVITGDITSGDDGLDIAGGAITISSDDQLTVATTATISSLGDPDDLLFGGISICGALVNGAITAGNGTITLTGANLDTIINAPLLSPGAILIQALRDVIINSSVTTTDEVHGSITLTADKNGLVDEEPVGTATAFGGVLISTAGSIDSAFTVDITGSDLWNGGAANLTLESVVIEADVAIQVTAVGTITIAQNGTAPSGADMIIDGVLESTEGSIEITAENRVLLSANLSADVDVEIHSALVLTGDVTVTAGNDATFDSTIDSDGTARSLTVNASGTTRFEGAVGAGDALASLTTDGAGSTEINGGSVTTTGEQQYRDNVTLGADTVLVGVDTDAVPDGEGVEFSGTVTGAGFDLEITGGGQFAKAVSGVDVFKADTIDTESTLSANSVEVIGDSELGGNVTALTGAISLGTTTDDDVTLTANVKLTSADVITVSGGIDGAHNLTLMAVNGTDVAETIGSSIVDLNVLQGSLVAGAIDITGNLDADTAVTTDAGSILVGGNIDAESSIDSASAIGVGGNFDVAGTVTAVTSITVDGNLDAESTVVAGTSIDVTGTSELGNSVTAQTGSITLGNDVTLTGDVILMADTTIAITGNVSGAFDLTFDAGTSSDVSGTIGTNIVNLTVNTSTLTAGAIDIDGDLDANAAIVTDIGGIDVGGNLDAESTIDSKTTISIAGTSELSDDVTSTGQQTYTGLVTLNDSSDDLITITMNGSNSGSINFAGGVDGNGDSLTVNSTGNFISGAIDLTDGVNPRGNLLVNFDTNNDSTNTATFAAITAGSVTITGGNDCNDTVTLNGVIDATLDVNLSNIATLNINAAMNTAGADVIISVCDDINLGVNGDITTLGGAVSLTADNDTDGNGAIFMADGAVIDARNGGIGTGTVTLQASESITLGQIFSDVGVSITSTNANIIDGTADELANITGTTLILSAATGIGSGTMAADAGDIDTDVDTLFATNSGTGASGVINITEVDAIDVHQLNQNGTGSVTLTTIGSSTVNGTITIVDGQSGITATTGTVTLTAQGMASDIVILESITTTGGHVLLNAANDVISTSGDDITTTSATSGAASGNVNIDAAGNISLAGDIVTTGNGTGTAGTVCLHTTGGAINDGRIDVANITATSDGTAGDINILASGTTATVTLNGTLETSNGGTVRIETTANIVDGSNDATADIVASRVLLRAVSGIGDGTASGTADINLVTAAGSATLTFAAVTNSGDINIANSGSLTVGTVAAGNGIAALTGVQITDSTGTLNSGDDDITLISTGALTTNAIVRNDDGGNIKLQSNGTATTNDVTINSAVSITGNTGQIDIDAGDSVVVAGTLNTQGGDVLIDAAQTVALQAATTTLGGHVEINAGAGVSSDASGSITTTATANSGIASGDVTINAGLSGAGSINLSAAINTTGADNNAGSGSAGGTVTLQAINAAGGVVTTTSSILTSGGNGSISGGAAGDVDIDATGQVSLMTTTAVGGNGTSGIGGNGGVVTINSNTDKITTMGISTFGGNGATLGGDGGSVTLIAKSDVTSTAITTRGGTGGTGDGGNGGTLTITSNMGKVQLTSVDTRGAGGLNGGDGGTIDIDAAGDIVVTTLGTSLNTGGGLATGGVGGNGGSIDVTTTGGVITANQIVATGGGGQAGGNGGAVTLDAFGTVSITTSIATGGGSGTVTAGGDGGAISVTSTNDAISIDTLSSQGGGSLLAGGNGGDVSLIANNAVTVLISIDTRGGNGMNGIGGDAGDVLICSAMAAIGVNVINTSGGTGNAANGGDAGSIVLDNRGSGASITLNGSLIAIGGNGVTVAMTGVDATVTILSGAAVIDNDDTQTDVIAGALQIQAETGVAGTTGANGALEVDVKNFAASTKTGSIVIVDNDTSGLARLAGLTIDTVSFDVKGTTVTTTGVTVTDNAGGRIDVAAVGEMTVNQVVDNAGDAAAATIRLAGVGINLATTSADVTADGGDITIDANTGNFNMVSGSSVESDGVGHNITISTNSASWATGASISSVGGTVTIAADTATRNINLGGGGGLGGVDANTLGAGSLNLNDAELDTISAANVLIGTASALGPFGGPTTGTITVTGDITADADFATTLFQLRTNDSVGTADNVAINADVTLTANNGGDFQVLAGGDITQTGAGGVTADVTVGGDGNVTYIAGNDIVLLANGVSASVTTTTGSVMFDAGRDIKQTGNGAAADVSVGGTGTIDFDAARDVTLTASNAGGSADLTTAGGTISVDAGRDILQTSINNGTTHSSTTGSGAVDYTAARSIVITGSADNTASITTENGAITLKANDSGMNFGGTFSGITLTNADISTGNATHVGGNILIQGTGGDTGSGNIGVRIESGTSIASKGSGATAGTITIHGHGGPGLAGNTGIIVDNSAITSIDGNIQAVGDSAGVGVNNDGVVIRNGATMTSTGTGNTAATITVTGTGSGVNGGQGIDIEGAGTLITSRDGDILLTGTTTGTGENHEGVVVRAGAVISSTGTTTNAALITILGTGSGAGTADNGNEGVLINGAGTQITSVKGNIQITGKSTGTGIDNDGVEIGGGAVISSTGVGADAATITIDGTASGTSDGEGVQIKGAGTAVRTVDGNVTITGVSNATGAGGTGIELFDGAKVTATGTAAVMLTGTAGNGGDFGVGVFIGDAGTEVTSNSGVITITGDGGNSGGSNYGVAILDESRVASVTGNINVTGRAGHGNGNNNIGVLVFDATVETTGLNADIVITGTGGNGSGSVNAGVVIESATVQTAGVGADIRLLGTSGSGSGSQGYGVQVSASDVQTAAGNLTVTGNSLAAGVEEHGVLIDTGSMLSVNGAGSVQILGTSSNQMGSSGNGVRIETASLVQVATGGLGTVTITGIDGIGANDAAVVIDDSTVKTDTTQITITGVNQDVVMSQTVGDALVLSNSGNALIQSSRNVLLGIVNLDADGIGMQGTAIITADANTTATNVIYGQLSDCVGQIVDNLNDERSNIIAASTALRAGSGIGNSGNDIDVDVNTLSARSCSGDIVIESVGAMTVTTVDGLAGVMLDSGAGAISLTTTGGSLVVDRAIMHGGSGPISLTATGAMSDITTNAAVSAASGNITIDADRNVVTNAVVTTGGGNVLIDAGDDITTNAAINSGGGNITLKGVNDITTNGTVTSGGGNVSYTAGLNIDVNGEIRSASGGSVIFDAGVDLSIDGSVTTGGGAVMGTAGRDILLNAAITSGGGNVTLLGDRDVTLTATGDISSQGGNIVVRADADGVGNDGAIFMADGSLVDAGSGTIDFSATDDITLGGLKTTHTGTTPAVKLVSTMGGIVDGGNTHIDIDANGVGAITEIRSKTSIGKNANGTVNSLETSIDVLRSAVTGIGHTAIHETDNITLQSVKTANGFIAVMSNGTIVATSVDTSMTDNNANDITLVAANDILVRSITTGGVNGDVSLTAWGQVLDTARGDGNRIIADDLVIRAYNFNPDASGNAVFLETRVNDLSVIVAGGMGRGDIDIQEFDNINLATSDAMTDFEMLFTTNGEIRVHAGGTINIVDTNTTNEGAMRTDDPEIVAGGANGRVELVAGNNFRMHDGTQIHASQTTAEAVYIEAKNDVRLGNLVEINTGNGVGVLRQIAPRPEQFVGGTAFFLFDTILTPTLFANGGLFTGILSFEVGVEGERGFRINIDWSSIESDRFQLVLGVSGDSVLIGPNFVISHDYTLGDLLFSLLNDRGTSSEPIPVLFSVSAHESIVIRGDTVTSADGLTTTDVIGNLLSTTDFVQSGRNLPGFNETPFENGGGRFGVPALALAPPPLVERPELPTYVPPAAAVPLEPVVSERIVTGETGATVISFSIGRDEYLELRVVSPDPDAAPLAIRRLPDEFLAGKEGASFTELFNGLPDGTYQIWYVLGTNRRMLVHVDVKNGEASIRSSDLDGGPLRLEELREELNRGNDTSDATSHQDGTRFEDRLDEPFVTTNEVPSDSESTAIASPENESADESADAAGEDGTYNTSEAATTPEMTPVDESAAATMPVAAVAFSALASSRLLRQRRSQPFRKSSRLAARVAGSLQGDETEIEMR